MEWSGCGKVESGKMCRTLVRCARAIPKLLSSARVRNEALKWGKEQKASPTIFISIRHCPHYHSAHCILIIADDWWWWWRCRQEAHKQRQSVDNRVNSELWFAEWRKKEKRPHFDGSLKSKIKCKFCRHRQCRCRNRRLEKKEKEKREKSRKKCRILVNPPEKAQLASPSSLTFQFLPISQHTACHWKVSCMHVHSRVCLMLMAVI